MGSIVSQINYWDGTSQSGQANGNTNPGALSYDWYLAFAVLGGFLGLDHLYLRSPSTAILKFFVNIFFYGAWWLFDALNAFFNKDVIKVFGVGIPGFGPYGIGAGCLSHDTPDKTHLNFFGYSFGLGFGGLFGLDSYMVGNFVTAIIRFICLISIIGSPIAFLAWFYEIARWLFLTTEVINEYPAFFGKKGVQGQENSWIMRFLPSFIAGPLNGVKLSIDALNGTFGEVGKKVVRLPENIGKIVEPIEKILNGAQAIGVAPSCAKDTVKTQMQGQMQGGQMQGSLSNKSDILPYLLIGTIGIITVSGIFSSYIRSKKSKEKSDPPPEPI